jgi:hypothetical protein
MQSAKPEQGAGELEQPAKIGGVFVVAHQERSALGEPSQRALHNPSFRSNS